MPLIELSTRAALRRIRPGPPDAIEVLEDPAMLRPLDGIVVSDRGFADFLEDAGAAGSALLDAGVAGGRVALELDAAGGGLRCVCRLRSRGELDARQRDFLRDILQGQLSDGFGSQPIPVANPPGAWVDIDTGPIAMRMSAPSMAVGIGRRLLDRLIGPGRGRSPIFAALAAGDVEGARRLAVSSRRHRDAVDRWGSTPLMIATRDGHTSLALFLLERGASPHRSTPGSGRTPIDIAAMVGDVAVGRALVMAGVDLDSPRRDPERLNDGMRPLMWAANRHHLEFARLLVDAGAQVDLQDARGLTAAHYAAAQAQPDLAIVEVLLAAGADMAIADRHGRTVLDEARAHARNLRPGLRELIERYRPGAFADDRLSG